MRHTVTDTVATKPLVLPSSVTEMRDVAWPLLQQHWDEVALNKEVMVLNPDWDNYLRMESAGILLALAAWVHDQMVGYCTGTVMPHPHYRDLVVYNNDVLFVAKPNRHGRLGKALMLETEAEAKKRGARMVLWHEKEGHPLPLGRHYRIQDTIWSKVI